MKKLLGKWACKASLREALFPSRVAWLRVSVRLTQPFGLLLHKVFLASTVSGTFPYAERKWGVIRTWATPRLKTDLSQRSTDLTKSSARCQTPYLCSISLRREAGPGPRGQLHCVIINKNHPLYGLTLQPCRAALCVRRVSDCLLSDHGMSTSPLIITASPSSQFWSASLFCGLVYTAQRQYCERDNSPAQPLSILWHKIRRE